MCWRERPGLLACRVELPIKSAALYDALAIDDTDGLLYAITANAIAEINLSSLPVPSFKNLRRVQERRLLIRTERS